MSEMDEFFRKVIPSDSEKRHSLKPNIANNQFELVGKGWNRWQYLFFDPQKNCVEPFSRIGENSVLQELDRHSHQCFQMYADSVKIKNELGGFQ